MTGAEALFCQMFSCGSADLELLDDVEYDWDDVLDQMDFPYQGMDFNDLLRAIFNVGFIAIREAVRECIDELEVGEKHGWLNEEAQIELRELRRLDPDNDFYAYCNCLDTHVYCSNHGGLYQQYMQHALDSFERNTGWGIYFV